MSLPKSCGWAVAAAFSVLIAVGDVGAQAVVLYDESVSGDVGAEGNPEDLGTLAGPGTYTIRGSLCLAGGACGANDPGDAFCFTVPNGYQVASGQAELTNVVGSGGFLRFRQWNALCSLGGIVEQWQTAGPGVHPLTELPVSGPNRYGPVNFFQVDSDPEDSYDYEWTFEVTGIPEFSASPDPLDFGGQEVGTTSGAGAVTLANAGTADLEVASITAAAAPFALTGGTCGATPFTVPTGGSCTLSYTFSPSVTGPASQVISVESNAAGSPDTYTLQGNGVQAQFSASPDPLDFGGQEVGTTSGAGAVTLANAGTADLEVASITAAAAPFALTGGTCGATPFTVPTGGSCTLSYTFSPSVTGPASQVISVESNAAGSPNDFTLRGDGTEAVLETSVSSISLETDYGQTAAQTVSISNSGTADLVISDIAGLTSPFELGGTSCLPTPTTIAPGGSCTLEVRFASSGNVGTFTDSINITSNAANGPEVIEVQGTMNAPVTVPSMDRWSLILLLVLTVALAGWSMRRPS